MRYLAAMLDVGGTQEMANTVDIMARAASTTSSGTAAASNPSSPSGATAASPSPPSPVSCRCATVHVTALNIRSSTGRYHTDPHCQGLLAATTICAVPLCSAMHHGLTLCKYCSSRARQSAFHFTVSVLDCHCNDPVSNRRLAYNYNQLPRCAKTAYPHTHSRNVAGYPSRYR